MSKINIGVATILQRSSYMYVARRHLQASSLYLGFLIPLCWAYRLYVFDGLCLSSGVNLVWKKSWVRVY